MLIIISFYCQPYIVNVQLENNRLGDGFEVTGIPEGIPSQAAYLTEYCYASVSSARIGLIKRCFMQSYSIIKFMYLFFFEIEKFI